MPPRCKTETRQLTVDASVAPCRVLTGEPHDQLPQRGVDGWASVTNRRLGPVASDESTVPSQDGLGAHDQEHVAQASPVECLCQHRKDRTIVLSEAGAVDLAT